MWYGQTDEIHYGESHILMIASRIVPKLLLTPRLHEARLKNQCSKLGGHHLFYQIDPSGSLQILRAMT
jgi:hypothetical protein